MQTNFCDGVEMNNLLCERIFVVMMVFSSHFLGFVVYYHVGGFCFMWYELCEFLLWYISTGFYCGMNATVFYTLEMN